MTINERLFLLIEEKNIKITELSRKIGEKQSTVSNWKQRKTDPPAKSIKPICDFLEVSPEYLLTGKENENDMSENEKELLSYFRKLPDREQMRELGRLEALAAQSSPGSESIEYKTG